MVDYSDRIEAFLKEKVLLTPEFKEKLLAHRKANRDRLIARLPDFITGLSVSEANFFPQGSFAMQTVIQTRFDDEEYDIDDGVVLPRERLVSTDGEELTASDVKESVRDALKDGRFNRQPRICSNCVRVFYADEYEEKHHVDFPAYRRYSLQNGELVRELAGENGWIQSDPTQVNKWFDDEIIVRNASTSGYGSQLRHLIQLLKRFCRSRRAWDLPNGMKLTMLVAECQPPHSRRLDEAFRRLLQNIQRRLHRDKTIRNLAHPNRPDLTRSRQDDNVVALEARVGEALAQLYVLDLTNNNDVDAARSAWDWIFQTDGYFDDFDAALKSKVSAPSRVASPNSDTVNVPWCEPAPWHLDIKHQVDVFGKFAKPNRSSTWCDFDSDGTPLDKGLSLRFAARTDTPKPYEVYWQVVNTGKEAEAAEGLRGKIIKALTAGSGGLSSTTAGGLFRDERTQYRGRHWIECFIVKGACCVARSGQFFVNIA